MFNANHNIETINNHPKVKEIFHKIELRKDYKNKKVYVLREKYDFSSDGFRDCGIYYKKSDVIEAINLLAENHVG